MELKFSIVAFLAIITSVVAMANGFINKKRDNIKQNKSELPINIDEKKYENWSFLLTTLIAFLGICMAVEQCKEENRKDAAKIIDDRIRFVFDSTSVANKSKFDSIIHAQNDTILSKTNMISKFSLLHTIDQLRLEMKADTISKHVNQNLAKTDDIFNFIYDGTNKPIIELRSGRIDLMKESYIYMPGPLYKFRSVYFVVSNRGKLDLENITISIKGSLGQEITFDGKNNMKPIPNTKEYKIRKLKRGSSQVFHEGFHLILVNHFENEFRVLWDRGSYKLSIKQDNDPYSGASRITDLRYYDENTVFNK